MTRKNLSLIIAIGFLALIGIIAVQVHWIRSAYDQNKINFEQSLNKAMNQIVFDLSRQENLFFGLETFKKGRSGFTFKYNKVHFIKDTDNKPHSKQQSEIRLKKYAKSGKAKTRKSSQKIIIHSINNNIEITQEFQLDSLSDQIENSTEVKASARALLSKDSLLKIYKWRIDSVRNLLDYNVLTIDNEKEELNKTMVELFTNIQSATRPFAERIPINKIEESIQRALKQYGLPLDYAFAIGTISPDSLLYQSENFETSLKSQSPAIQLFPHALVASPEYLYLNFPGSNPLFNKMLWPISLAFIFTLLLLASLLIIVNNLLHHKRLSAIKTDFINNMTHEFKTPIATIQLASDSVMTEQVLKDPKRISYFMHLIKGENKRMNALVERILQMAQLEKKSFSLVKSKVDLHQLIEAVVENSSLKIKQVNGQINLKLEAEKYILMLDEMHITNVLFNLIDNAIKYRKDDIQIEIGSSLDSKAFILTIEDNGQGMNEETKSQIFDKFFRLTEGNIHTIKGYGLGLSYVKAIIEKHRGSIQVFSQEGRGSRFEIRLPLNA